MTLLGALVVLIVIFAAVRILGNGQVDMAGIVLLFIVACVAFAYFGRGRL